MRTYPISRMREYIDVNPYTWNNICDGIWELRYSFNITDNHIRIVAIDPPDNEKYFNLDFTIGLASEIKETNASFVITGIHLKYAGIKNDSGIDWISGEDAEKIDTVQFFKDGRYCMITVSLFSGNDSSNTYKFQLSIAHIIRHNGIDIKFSIDDDILPEALSYHGLKLLEYYNDNADDYYDL